MEQKELPTASFEQFSTKQKKKLSKILDGITNKEYKKTDFSNNDYPILKTVQKNLEEKTLELKKQLISRRILLLHICPERGLHFSEFP